MSAVTAPKRAATLLFAGAIVAIVVAGVIFRTLGVFTGTLDFWADEAWWIELTMLRSLPEAGIRPIGYMWLAQRLVGFENQELLLRLPSFVAGIGAIGCMAFAARRVLDNRLMVVLAVALVALHPQLIVFSKEFKPYSVEVFLHIGLTLWALTCLERRTISTGFGAAMVAAIPFCYNILFLYPGLLIAIISVRSHGALGAVCDKVARLTAFQWTVAAIAAIASFTLLHIVVSDALNTAPRQGFWGEKYDVFPVGLSFLQAAGWYVEKTWALITMPADLIGLSPGAAAAAKHLFGVAYLAGIASLMIRRQLVILALLAGPLLMAVLANMLGYWPYGAFRTNLFLIPGAALVGCIGFQQLASIRHLHGVVTGIVVAMLILFIPVDAGYHRTKHMRDGAPSPQMTEVLDEILRRYHGDGSPVANVIVGDWHSWRPLRHYLEVSPRGRTTYSSITAHSTLVRGPLNDVDELADLLGQVRAEAQGGYGTTRVWLVVTKQSSFESIAGHPLVTEFGVRVDRYAMHDPIYHPVLIELRIPGR